MQHVMTRPQIEPHRYVPCRVVVQARPPRFARHHVQKEAAVRAIPDLFGFDCRDLAVVSIVVPRIHALRPRHRIAQCRRVIHIDAPLLSRLERYGKLELVRNAIAVQVIALRRNHQSLPRRARRIQHHHERQAARKIRRDGARGRNWNRNKGMNLMRRGIRDIDAQPLREIGQEPFALLRRCRKYH